MGQQVQTVLEFRRNTPKRIVGLGLGPVWLWVFKIWHTCQAKQHELLEEITQNSKLKAGRVSQREVIQLIESSNRVVCFDGVLSSIGDYYYYYSKMCKK